MKVFIIAILLLLLVSCAASGPLFNKDAHQRVDSGAKLIVYLSGPGHHLDLFLNDNSIGLIRHNGFVSYETMAGKHILSASTRWDIGIPPKALEIELQSNQITYVKYNPRFDHVRYVGSCGQTEEIVHVCWRDKYTPAFEIINQTQALTELVSLKQSL